MKKIILKSLVVLSLFFLLLLSGLSTIDIPLGRAFKWVRSEESKTYKNLILGNSIGISMLKRASTKNLCLNGVGVMGGYYLLQEFLKNNPDSGIKALFLAYAPNYISKVSPHTIKRGGYSFSTRQVKEIIYLRDSLGDDFIFFEDFPHYPLLMKIPAVGIPVMKLLRHHISYFRRKIQIGQLLENLYRYAVPYSLLHKKPRIDTSKQKGRLWLDSKKDFSYTWSPLNIHYLKEIKTLCQKHKIRLIYLHLPLNQSAKFPEKRWFDDYYSILDSIGLEQIPPRIEFLEQSFFQDKFGHLNRIGRDYFEKTYLLPQLKQARVEDL